MLPHSHQTQVLKGHPLYGLYVPAGYDTAGQSLGAQGLGTQLTQLWGTGKTTVAAVGARAPMSTS